MSAGDRELLTVLFTDIVGSTKLAARLGDAKFRDLLDRHDAMVRAALKKSGGREVNTTGDGFVAVFPAPGKAIACAQQVMAGAAELAIEARAGLHTGEVERRGKDVTGVGVVAAARIAELAGAGEILVSATVKDLVDGSDVTLAPWGTRTLRGLPGRRKLFAVGDTAPPPRRGVRSAKAKAPARSARLRVLLADDHQLWRQTLRTLLEHNGVATVVAEAEDGAEAVALVADHQPDVVVMDIDMPSLTGIDATRKITDADPGVKVLMLSSLKDRDEVMAAVNAGASGYLIKTASATEVADAISRVSRGELAFPPELTGMVLAELRAPHQAPAAPPRGLASLSAQENKVLALMADGKSNQAISQALHVSSKTVESHIAAIFTKLGLEPAADQHRRVQAVIAYLGKKDPPG